MTIYYCLSKLVEIEAIQAYLEGGRLSKLTCRRYRRREEVS